MKPPLHRKFDIKESTRMVKERYEGLKGLMDAQVRLLQESAAFRRQCAERYESGYKDWQILSAIFNHMLALRARQLGISLATPEGQKRFQALADQLNDVVFDAEQFKDKHFDMAFTMHALSCAKTYGFEPRTAATRPDVLEKFLKERMRHFEIDLPHSPMFGAPVGKWPL